MLFNHDTVGQKVFTIGFIIDFEDTETQGKRILNFLLNISYDLFVAQFSTMKARCVKLYRVLTNYRHVRYSVLHMSVTGNRVNWTQ